MVTMDGFIISHAMEVMHLLEDEKVKQWVGGKCPKTRFSTWTTLSPSGRWICATGIWNTSGSRRGDGQAKPVILDVARDYAKLSGREYGLFEEYMLDDAEIAIVVLGSTAGTAKEVVKALRADGVKAGLLKVRVFRPFPACEIARALQGKKAVAVMDRSDSFNAVSGPVFAEVRSAMRY